VEAFTAVEVDVLQRVEDVEPAHPEQDGEAEPEHPRVRPPVTAIHAASGAAPRQAPRMRCDAHVNRFMYE